MLADAAITRTDFLQLVLHACASPTAPPGGPDNTMVREVTLSDEFAECTPQVGGDRAATGVTTANTGRTSLRRLLPLQTYFDALYDDNAIRTFHRDVNGDTNASVGQWNAQSERVNSFVLPLNAPAFVKRMIGSDSVPVTETQKLQWGDGRTTLTVTSTPTLNVGHTRSCEGTAATPSTHIVWLRVRPWCGHGRRRWRRLAGG
jgi:hypothetical protein